MMTKVKDATTEVVTEPAWLNYNRFMQESSASADPAQYYDDCFAAVRQLGVEVETLAATLRQLVSEDNHLSENTSMWLLGDLDLIDQQVGAADDLINKATGCQRGVRRGIRPESMQSSLAQAYRHLQQTRQELIKVQERLGRR
ncbi:MAG: hypothetical protein Q7S64_03305 [bacterium]|nr:hypothetical protein [bacterium]